MKRFRTGAISLVLLSVSLSGQTGMERRDGFIPMLWDSAQGKLLFEITKFDQDILYFTEVAKGSGSGNVGFEWAAESEGGVIQFQRVGPKVMVVQKNLRFRPGSGGPGMVQGVDQSFPDSILASLPIVSSDGGRVLVDATPLIIRDSVRFAAPGGNGRGGQPGEVRATTLWRFDPNRSAIYLPRTKGYPKNTEVEVTVTYEATSGGARTTPEASILTGRLHHSFVEPPTGYTPRAADARIGVGSVRFSDFSKPDTGGKEVEWIRRHRIEKKDPNAALSEPKQPIV